jgi:hypothetical protein
MGKPFAVSQVPIRRLNVIVVDQGVARRFVLVEADPRHSGPLQKTLCRKNEVHARMDFVYETHVV